MKAGAQRQGLRQFTYEDKLLTRQPVCCFAVQGNVKGALNGKASANARGKVDAILASLQGHGVDPNQVKVRSARQ